MFSTIMASVGSLLILGNGQTLETDISLSNPTRLVFEDDRPTKMIFNEADVNAPAITATLGNSGDIYLTVEQGKIGQDVKGFVITESGKTYPVKFSIRSIDTPQITVASAELREAARAAKKAGSTAEVADVETVKWTRESSYHQSIARLIVGLYHNQAPEGFKRKLSFKRMTSIQGVDRKLTVRYAAANISAATYELTNGNEYSVHVPNLMDSFGPYLALSYSDEDIGPGATGYLYIVSKEDARASD